MSWLFSQALAEEFLAEPCSAGARSALSSPHPSPQAFSCADRTTARSRRSRSGMTCAPLTVDHGAALLTWFLAASRARTSASPARAPASTANAPDCGPTWRASWARYDRATSTWRTAQPSLFGDSGESSPIWPRSGMTAGGLCWELPTLVLHTSGTGSGSYVPAGMTPMPGPRWATPTARDWRSGKASAATHARNSRPLSEQVGGLLNPMWVEWLMGWPAGWTDSRPWATDRSRCAPPRRGDCSPTDSRGTAVLPIAPAHTTQQPNGLCIESTSHD
jgi:hypothetical protein